MHIYVLLSRLIHDGNDDDDDDDDDDNDDVALHRLKFLHGYNAEGSI